MTILTLFGIGLIAAIVLLFAGFCVWGLVERGGGEPIREIEPTL